MCVWTPKKSILDGYLLPVYKTPKLLFQSFNFFIIPEKFSLISFYFR